MLSCSPDLFPSALLRRLFNISRVSAKRLPISGSALLSNVLQMLAFGTRESELPEFCRELRIDCVRIV